MVNKKVTFLRPTDPPVEDLPETFIDRYTDWAKEKTDAPEQYHRALGAGVLSAVCAPHVVFPVSYGNVIPNLWIMILAGTTTTRKSTSLNIAGSLLDDVIEEWKLGTDGSPEGLLTELGYRDDTTSVFLRDEIAGFMRNTSRDYMSGILEAFCQLYDGVAQSRVLRHEKIEIKKPYFLIMGGGIKSYMEEVVTMDHIRSGFIPRFIIVSGSTTSDSMRPISPPTADSQRKDGQSKRDKLYEELWNVYKYISTPEKLEEDNVPKENPLIMKMRGVPVSESAAPTTQKNVIKVQGTDEFWVRLRQLESDAVKLGEESTARELYTPLYFRLSHSVLKLAVLLAVADQRDIVELHDLQKAVHFSQEWIASVTDFAANVEAAPEMDKWEKKAQKIVEMIRLHPPNEEVTQTDVLQRFRIRKKDIYDIEQTLVARGLVKIKPWPHSHELSGKKIFYSLPDPRDKPRAMRRSEREGTFLANAEEERHAETKPPTNGHRIRFPTSRTNGDED